MVKEKLVAKLRLPGFVSLDQFHAQKLRLDESPSLYWHKLKQLLERAMPGVNVVTRDQLLIHQFLLGLPIGISHQLRATRETTELDPVVDRARLLMTLEEQEHSCTAAISSNEPRQYKSYETKWPCLLNKLLRSLLQRVDAHSGVSGATGRDTPSIRAPIIIARPKGISSAGSVAN